MKKLTVDNASPLFIAAQEGLPDCMNTLLSAGKFEVSRTDRVKPMHRISIIIHLGVNKSSRFEA